MKKLLALLALSIVGCAHNSTSVLVDKRIEGAKVVALDAPRAPWVTDIEARLRKAGYKVLRKASLKKVTEETVGRKEEYQEATTRYVLVIDGAALTDQMHRCFGGGWDFDYLNAELVDTSTNETVLTVAGSGYSENCPPLSGSLFANIVKALDGAWTGTPSSAPDLQ